MDFVKEIEAFFDACDRDNLNSSDVALWLTLMHINRKAGWKKKFTASSSAIRTKVGLPETTFKEARRRLVDKGFIKYQSVGSPLSEYQMISNIIVEEKNKSNELESSGILHANGEAEPLSSQSGASGQLENDHDVNGSFIVDEKSYLGLKQRFDEFESGIKEKEVGKEIDLSEGEDKDEVKDQGKENH